MAEPTAWQHLQDWFRMPGDEYAKKYPSHPEHVVAALEHIIPGLREAQTLDKKLKGTQVQSFLDEQAGHPENFYGPGELGSAVGVVETGAKSIIENLGLKYKGELTKGSGVHMFEHPDHPGKTAALPESEITPEAVKEKMASKLKEFNEAKKPASLDFSSIPGHVNHGKMADVKPLDDRKVIRSTRQGPVGPDIEQAFDHINKVYNAIDKGREPDEQDLLNAKYAARDLVKILAEENEEYLAGKWGHREGEERKSLVGLQRNYNKIISTLESGKSTLTDLDQAINVMHHDFDGLFHWVEGADFSGMGLSNKEMEERRDRLEKLADFFREKRIGTEEIAPAWERSQGEGIDFSSIPGHQLEEESEMERARRNPPRAETPRTPEEIKNEQDRKDTKEAEERLKRKKE